MKNNFKLYLSVFLIIVFSFFTILLKDIGINYYRIIRPILWAGLLLIIVFINTNRRLIHPNKKQVTITVIICGMAYFVLNFTFGYLTGFANNPFNRSLQGIFLNALYYIPIIFLKEMTRYVLLENISREKPLKLCALIVIAFTICDVENYSILFSLSTLNEWMEFIFRTMFVNLCLNIFFTYTSYYSSYVGNIIYRIIPTIFMLLLPFLPDIPWALSVIIEVLPPFFGFLIIEKIVAKEKYNDVPQSELKFNYQIFIVPLTLIFIFVIFGLGYLKVVPVAVATNSMKPIFQRGDAVVISKKDRENIEVNDIIQYRLQDITVIHRVIEVKKTNGQVTYITKGDNNNTIDIYPVREEQIIGKLKYVIPKIGYPSLWIKEWGNVDVSKVPIETKG